jgi:hypothetical protein
MQKGRDPNQITEMDALSETNQPVKLLELQQRFQHKDATLVFDEISQAPILQFAHINNRLREIGRTDINQVKCGDFNQIPCVGGISIPKMIETLMIYPESITTNKRLHVEAAKDFMEYTLIRLTQQNRTQDAEHLGRIKRIVDYSQDRPISEEFIQYLLSIQLKPSDIQDDESQWISNATILVASNAERFFMNKMFAELYIKVKAKVGIFWALKRAQSQGSEVLS